eukprot:SM000083S22728  [mRNA]  locus=s83:172501:177743:- [translate_table: standard]
MAQNKFRRLQTLSRPWQTLRARRAALLASKSRVFAEDLEPAARKWTILDPRSAAVLRWDQLFVCSCLASVFVDPLFFFLPVMDAQNVCVEIQHDLAVVVTVLRTIADTIYLLHVVLQFRVAYVAPSKRVLGRGELVVDPHQIALRYLRKDFWLDIVALLPLPQLFIWAIMPAFGGNQTQHIIVALEFTIAIQYIPRLFRIFPLMSNMRKNSGVLMETAWAGAAFNLSLYLLASHVAGSGWYILSVDRLDRVISYLMPICTTICWHHQCDREETCKTTYLECRSIGRDGQRRAEWLMGSLLNQSMPNSACPISADFSLISYYGIYLTGVANAVTDRDFFQRYFYSLWWGLQELSSLGQGLQPSTNVWENIVCIVITIAGLLLFALLVGQMQTYLQSLTLRLEEMRVKRRDTEQWMQHRQLPMDLRERIRRFDQYKWIATRGVDEEPLLASLPMDLRRDIKRHLCLDLVRQVPLFSHMDDRVLDAICERLKPALYTESTIILREGDPVACMFFVIRGRLESITTNGGRTGFFNTGTLGPGDFCGEELLTWALDPRPSKNFPSSTRTVTVTLECEAFSLDAEDLRYVACQFRRLHSRRLQHTFRYYSHQWRTWAASFIQVKWRRHKRKQQIKARRQLEQELLDKEAAATGSSNGPRTNTLITAMLAKKFMNNALRNVQRRKAMEEEEELPPLPKLEKPREPIFLAEEEEGDEADDFYDQGLSRLPGDAVVPPSGIYGQQASAGPQHASSSGLLGRSGLLFRGSHAAQPQQPYVPPKSGYLPKKKASSKSGVPKSGYL